jgi:hypothetical protein
MLELTVPYVYQYIAEYIHLHSAGWENGGTSMDPRAKERVRSERIGEGNYLNNGVGA